jgi:methyl-galactoside transport system substrate-binding protein
MKILKTILKIIMVSVMMIIIITCSDQNVTSTSSIVAKGELIKIGVLLYRFDDDYISLVRQNLEEIQKQNEGKVDFTFYDGKNDQYIQNKSLDTLLKKKIWIFYC